jgi:hypothetical protein
VVPALAALLLLARGNGNKTPPPLQKKKKIPDSAALGSSSQTLGSSQSPTPRTAPIPPVSGCPRPAGPRGGSGLPAGGHALMEPRVANKFRLGRKLGSGSFGEIFLGTHVQTNEEVAIKLVSSTRSD